ncbi:hypothetical protein JXC34_04670, partial [Candidatus Woesearchaeota archaeon]|nr:hypothetical protein [Candidatus Woesearchaeota archaeon]
VSEFIGKNNALVGHFYYVPPEASPEDKALNQKDKGFGQYPELSCEEALILRTEYSNPAMMALVEAYLENYL